MSGIVTTLVRRSQLDAMDDWPKRGQRDVISDRLASAFKELGSILPADGGDCEDLLSRFADGGVDIDSLATQLQEEGAKAFVKSWGELMPVIEGTGVRLEKAAR